MSTASSDPGAFLKGSIKSTVKSEIKSKIIKTGGRKALEAVARYSARKAAEEAGKEVVRQSVVRGWQAAANASTGVLGASATAAPAIAAISTGANILLAFQMGYASGTLINNALIGDKESVHGTIKRQAKERLDLLWGPQGYDFTDDKEFAAAVDKNNSDSSKKKFNGLEPREVDPSRRGYITTALNAGFGLRQQGKELPEAVSDIYKLFDNGYLNSENWFKKAAAERKSVEALAKKSLEKARAAIEEDEKKGIYRNKTFSGTSEFKDFDKEYVYRVTGENVIPGDKNTISQVEIVYSPKDPEGKRISREKPLVISPDKKPKAYNAIVSMFFDKFAKKFINHAKPESTSEEGEQVSESRRVVVTSSQLREFVLREMEDYLVDRINKVSLNL